MQILSIINSLTVFTERQGDSIALAGDVIASVLTKNNIVYTEDYFKIKTPIGQASLIADGVSIDCLSCSFNSGTIESKAALLSSAISSGLNFETPNINFNPFCDIISRANFYAAPAIAVAKKDVKTILNAEKVSGTVTVKMHENEVCHILVGNNKNPRSIVFAHYDSIGTGALDNASGVAVCLATLIESPELLKTTLFVFDPCEELSLDKPTYWGYGFRMLEEKYPALFEKAEKLIPVDCVGNGPVHLSADPDILRLAFPVKRFDEFKNKMVTMYSDIEGLMRVYHSAADTADKLSETYLREAAEKLKAMLAD